MKLSGTFGYKTMRNNSLFTSPKRLKVMFFAESGFFAESDIPIAVVDWALLHKIERKCKTAAYCLPHPVFVPSAAAIGSLESDDIVCP